MKPGRVSWTAGRRSLAKQLHTGAENSLLVPSYLENCHGIFCPEGNQVLSCQETVWGREPDLGVYALARAANALACKGAVPQGVSASILLPEEAEEAELAELARRLSQAAREAGISFLEAKADTLCQSRMAAVTVTVSGTAAARPDSTPAAGTAQPGETPAPGTRRPDAPAPGADIVLIKWAGLEAGLRIRCRKAQEAERYFPSSFLELVDAGREKLFSLKEIQAALAGGTRVLYPAGEGGIFAALWNLAEGEQTGFTVDLKQIAIRQETIELCERFHINPYQSAATGCVLALAEKGEALAETLEQQGICARVIGRIQKGKQKILVNGGETRYLDRPAPDGITALYQAEKPDV